MKTCPLSYVLFLVAACLNTAVLAEDALSDQEKIQANWKIISFEPKPAQAPTVRPQIKITFREDKLIMAGPRGERQLQFSLDPATMPKSIDLTLTEGDNKGKVVKGIYALADDKLTVCVGPPGADRPTEFRAGERIVLVIFERTE